MSLNSLSLIVFLPMVVLVNFLLPRRRRYVWLFFASCLFYLSNDPRFAYGLAFCIGTTYGTGLLLGKGRGILRKFLLGGCVLVNVLALCLYRIPIGGIHVAPLGISFYMLQALGYVVDVYRNRVKAEGNPLRYAVFVAFFPTVISGPIQRGEDMLPQIREGSDFDYRRARSGLYYLLGGYLLKLVMADGLGAMVDFAYNDYGNMPGATLLFATILYAVQLYCDFAGYSSLAIGAAKLLGFELKENFRQPYFAVSVRDFWNRWHISLSSWLRDYVYIPLGGNRKGRCRKYFNLLVTFLVSGLWHGFGINFLIWGALHGLYQVAGSIVSVKEKRRQPAFFQLAKMGLTFVLVDFAWLFFRADSAEQAFHILERILFHFDFKQMTYYGSYMLGGTKADLIFMLAGMVIVFLIDFLHERKFSVEAFTMNRVHLAVRWTMYIGITLFLLLVIVRNYGQAASTFIYANF